MKRPFYLLCCLVFLFSVHLYSSPRITFSINEHWKFIRQDIPGGIQNINENYNWEIIDLPHTWNIDDVMDDEPGYYQGFGWYKKQINIPESYKNKQITIFFEGINQEAELFVNGDKVGSHVGGYTRFSFDITKFLQFGATNQLVVRVTNRYNPDIPPLSADFTFFGGIYRDVYLIATEKQHFSTTHYASSGVYINTPLVSEKQATVEIKSFLSNQSDAASNIRIEHSVINPDKQVIEQVSKKIKLKKQVENIPVELSFNINSPELWSPESPALYTVRTRIYEGKTGALLDEVIQPLGFRWFEFTTEKGFCLNGKPYKLIGTNRHQCFDKMGNALPDEIHVRDVKLLKDMGGNFLRVSHYPQDPVVMEMCDKLGIITSVEIPIVNTITENSEFAHNCLHMAKEMVMQDYNRPSVMIWAYMNEVLLRLPYTDTEEEKSNHYLKSIQTLAQQIEDQIRADDPYRYTLIPFHGNFKLYHESGLTQTPKIVGWNLYQGWYGGTFDGFDKFLDQAHAVLPTTPFIITEYGADVDPRLHSFEPQRFDYTQEWANLYHEHYYKAIMERDFVVGAAIWNLNDFHSEIRGNAVPHINNKGIVSTKREVKDTYLHYQALLKNTPVINIGGRNWNIRSGIADEDYTTRQMVKVYTNLPEVELFVNGKSLGVQQTENAIAIFDVPFQNGENVLKAVGHTDSGKIYDLLKIDFRMIASSLRDTNIPFESINIMLGSKRYFEEKDKSVIWIPEQEYSPGSWGYIGGESYSKKTRHGKLPASDFNILNTDIDPVFQTMRQGLESFKLDVPDGEYTVNLYFSELKTSEVQTIAYNLGNDALTEDVNERVFNVDINGVRVINRLNLSDEYGPLYPVVKKFIIRANDNSGISIDFTAEKDETMLNAIRVYRNY